MANLLSREDKEEGGIIFALLFMWLLLAVVFDLAVQFVTGWRSPIWLSFTVGGAAGVVLAIRSRS